MREIVLKNLVKSCPMPVLQSWGGALACVIMALSDRSSGLISDYDYYGQFVIGAWLAGTGLYLLCRKQDNASTASLWAFVLLSVHLQISWGLSLVNKNDELAQYSLISTAVYIPALYLAAYVACPTRVSLMAWGNYGVLAVSSMTIWGLSANMAFERQQIILLVVLLHPLLLCFLHIGKYLAEQENELTQQQVSLQKAVSTDPLTRLGTRSMLRDIVSQDNLALEKGECPYIAIGVLDIDFFKKINDKWGHSAGDKALAYMGEILRDRLPSSCVAIRWGGEEFVVLCRNKEDLGVYDTLRVALAKESASRLESGALTVSIGVAWRTLDSKASITQLLAAADEAVYRAKKEGRNRVIMHNSESLPGPPQSQGGLSA